MMNQFTVDVSPLSLELMTKEVALVILASGTDRCPSVPPVVLRLMNIFEDEVTAVVLTVTVPATRVAVPTLAFDPVAILILLPAVVRLRFPVMSTASVGVPVAPKAVFPTKLLVVNGPGWYTPLLFASS